MQARAEVTRFLFGLAALFTVLLGTSAVDATGRYGLLILAAVLATGALVVRAPARTAFRRLGLGRPAGPALFAAFGVGALIQLVYPLSAALTGMSAALRPGWPWLLLGIFAFHGIAEEVVWRGYAFGWLRRGRSFGRAVLWTMPLLAVAHLPILTTSGLLVGTAALLVAAVTSVPLAHLYEAGRATVWAPAVLHTAIDSFKIVEVRDAAEQAFSLLLAAVSIALPLLVLAVVRRPATAYSERSAR